MLTLRLMPTHVDLLAPYVPPHEMHLLDALGRGRRHHKSVIGRIGEGAYTLDFSHYAQVPPDTQARLASLHKVEDTDD